jgi:hypothetical protein
MARRKQPVHWDEISMEHGGKTYRARYYVTSATVILETMSADGVSQKRSTQIGGSTAQFVALMLLREAVDAGQVQEYRLI